MRPILKKRPDWRNAGVSQLRFFFEGKTLCTHSQLYFAVKRNIWKIYININTALCQERNLKRRHSSWAWGLLCEHPALHIGQPHRAHNTFWWSSLITLFCLINISNLKTNHKEHKTPFDDLHKPLFLRQNFSIPFSEAGPWGNQGRLAKRSGQRWADAPPLSTEDDWDITYSKATSISWNSKMIFKHHIFQSPRGALQLPTENCQHHWPMARGILHKTTTIFYSLNLLFASTKEISQNQMNDDVSVPDCSYCTCPPPQLWRLSLPPSADQPPRWRRSRKVDQAARDLPGPAKTSLLMGETCFSLVTYTNSFFGNMSPGPGKASFLLGEIYQSFFARFLPNPGKLSFPLGEI